MDLFSVLVTGTNRGIGLEFVMQLTNLSKPPKHIFATYRNENTIQKLKEIERTAPSPVQVHLIKFDVRDYANLDTLRSIVEGAVGDKGLTLLINNAGVATELPFPDVTAEHLRFHFEVNAVAPILIAQTFFPLLKKAASLKEKNGMNFSKAAILNISSHSASIADTPQDDIDCPSYKVSKVALNMAMRIMALKLKEDNVLIVNMCPGWVKTDMGSETADISPEESVATILRTILRLNENHHGTFVDRFGNPHRW